MSKYFTENELKCKCGKCTTFVFDSGLLKDLDGYREFINKPVSLLSAYRCTNHNNEVGGVSGSAHEDGLAVDIKVSNSTDRFNCIQFFVIKGYTRLGIGKDFVHVDKDLTKPSNVIWTYY